ncbi:hypothetical protein PR202_ga18201 [Eleusine coracana subsp. coracana]|uniref:Uncharacterized protein n=1 Tax=Eleusine coracana subsp. coracana TaxID=191504 RepID=A0AAV5CQV8_ELECO|nr:hypothetical protein PR202_ga18201 [Eleusine coracana subsp. coracana]
MKNFIPSEKKRKPATNTEVTVSRVPQLHIFSELCCGEDAVLLHLFVPNILFNHLQITTAPRSRLRPPPRAAGLRLPRAPLASTSPARAAVLRPPPPPPPARTTDVARLLLHAAAPPPQSLSRAPPSPGPPPSPRAVPPGPPPSPRATAARHGKDERPDPGAGSSAAAPPRPGSHARDLGEPEAEISRLDLRRRNGKSGLRRDGKRSSISGGALLSLSLFCCCGNRAGWFGWRNSAWAPRHVRGSVRSLPPPDLPDRGFRNR